MALTANSSIGDWLADDPATVDREDLAADGVVGAGFAEQAGKHGVGQHLGHRFPRVSGVWAMRQCRVPAMIPPAASHA